MGDGHDIHQIITDQIIHSIEHGPGDFQMPWHRASSRSLPVNATTGKTCRGVDIISLRAGTPANNYCSNQWATFQQWKQRGAAVRKGEKGTLVAFHKKLAIDDTGQTDASPASTKAIMFAKPSRVFNAAQVDGFAETVAEPPPASTFEIIDHAGQVAEATEADIRHGGDLACYRSLDDSIQLPDRGKFTGSATSTPREAYCSTLLHELGHRTGAEHRLDREKGKRFAGRAYCFEEVIAELTGPSRI